MDDEALIAMKAALHGVFTADPFDGQTQEVMAKLILRDLKAAGYILVPERTVTPSTGKAEPPPGWVGEDGK